jgi:ribosomal-protein-alanine N-acetyltransferase
MKTLTTERLTLRRWKESDLDDFYHYARNPNIGPNAGWQPHTDKTQSLEILRSFIQQDDVWAIVDNHTQRAIGSLALHADKKRDNHKTRMLGYVLAEEFWGQGLMTEAVKRVLQYAFEDLELDLVSVFHYPSNRRSQRVIEKCGFKYEGTLRLSSTLFNGSVHDDVCYSITREEYTRSTA